MTAPKNEIVQMSYQNPHASMPLILPVLVLCNTSDADLERNIRINAAREDLRWISKGEPHDLPAIMCGGGPSIAHYVDTIGDRAREGAAVFAMNAASKYLRGNGIPVDYQVIADAKEETASLVDPSARAHLFASQVNEKTMNAVTRPRVWHLAIDSMEEWFPEARRKRGGYVLIGGGASVGNSALCLAYAMGFREFHIFGYDSCHSGKHSHAYAQPMNDLIPVADVEWGGKKFRASVAMKAQAEKFQITGQALQQEGCTLHVYGEGLLQTMWHTPPASLTEREKYRTLWQFDDYRTVSPGEDAVPQFLQLAKPRDRFIDFGGTETEADLIVDFGCGTGRAALALHKKGYAVMLVDFADNCRDDEALGLPFLEWDLSLPCPLSAPFGFCADVMEHIPTEQVDAVIRNIMGSAKHVFFQISTVADQFGAVVHQTLHNTVQPHHWWADRFLDLGYEIAHQNKGEIASQFYIHNPASAT